MKILLFGKNGQVGWELQRSLSPLGELIALSSSSNELCGDLSNLTRIAQTIQTVKPAIIVNAAAYTAVDKAESEPQPAQTLNTEAPRVIAQEARKLGAWLVHYSTDYVFDGNGKYFYSETDDTAPLNVYGQTKLAGEKYIRTSGCAHLIFRTSWVYATSGNNFIKTILRLAQQRDKLSVVNDQIGSPTGAELIADVTANALLALRHTPDASGLYHLTASGSTSWYGFAKFILEQAERADLSLKTRTAQLEAINSDNYPLPAKRPLNSCLNTEKLKTTFGFYLPPWELGASRTIHEIISLSSNQEKILRN